MQRKSPTSRDKWKPFCASKLNSALESGWGGEKRMGGGGGGDERDKDKRRKREEINMKRCTRSETQREVKKYREVEVVKGEKRGEDGRFLLRYG